ncbi:hypothetical protein FBU30_000882 [Linnemannia zychae]|nr:hypothetical protein FBU30_000882 [Linnemannia zychae]
MGIKDLWSSCRKNGLTLDAESTVRPPSPKGKVRVGVCGSHFSDIRYIYNNAQADINIAHTRLAQQLLQYGSKDAIVLYVDGHSAIEKSGTHIEREKVRRGHRQSAQKQLKVLVDRLSSKKRIKKHHITKLNNHIKAAFCWKLEDRRSFVQFMTNADFNIILCGTEADVQIASDCQPDDVVVTSDSDLLVYKSVSVVWRPVGRGKTRKFLVYKRAAILEVFNLASESLMALAIVSHNDYNRNIPSLGLATNLKLIRNIEEDIKNENTNFTAFANALKVFVFMQQDPVSDSMTLPQDGLESTLVPSYVSLQSAATAFFAQLDERKKEEFEARKQKRYTIDKPNPDTSSTFRKRYSPKERYHDPSRKHEPPPIMLQYTFKPWKGRGTLSDKLTEESKSVDDNITTSGGRVKPLLQGNFQLKNYFQEMSREHPTVTLDLGTLETNISTALKDDTSLQGPVLKSIRQAVHEASKVKRRFQEPFGLYCETVLYPRPRPTDLRPSAPVETLHEEDRFILNKLCPRLLSKDMDAISANDNNNDDEKESSDGFISVSLSYLYSGNLPRGSQLDVNQIKKDLKARMLDKDKVDRTTSDISKNNSHAVNLFICRLQHLGLLPASDKPNGEPKKKTEFTPNRLITSMIQKKQLSLDQPIILSGKIPTIHLFAQLNSLTGDKWILTPLPSPEDGFMTFTETELAAFFYMRIELRDQIKKLTGITKLTQAALVDDWLPVQAPGQLINQFIAPVFASASTGIIAAIREFDLDGNRVHINGLRSPAFKLRELQSVRYKRYPKEILPERLLSTTAGTDDHLTEVRNVFNSKDDVERLLGCTGDQIKSIAYLGIDLGQACVVGAYSDLPDDMQSKRGRKQHRGKKKKRGSRGRRKKGRKRKKHRKGDKTGEAGVQPNKVRHINLAAKQKTVALPTLRHRRWMEAQKDKPLEDTKSQMSCALVAPASTPAAPTLASVIAPVPVLQYQHKYQS